MVWDQRFSTIRKYFVNNAALRKKWKIIDGKRNTRKCKKSHFFDKQAESELVSRQFLVQYFQI